jgi:AcrR family transcriptional regulator
MKRTRTRQGAAQVPPKPGRRERRRAEIREKLYEAALHLFMTRGVQATTVKDITDAADLGKGTFFNYFPTKEHILATFYERQLAGAEDALQAAQERGELVRKTLETLVARTSEEASRSSALVRSFLIAIIGNPRVGDIVLPLLQLRRQRIEELLTIGQERGEIRRDWPASEMARIQQELAFGTSLFWALEPRAPLNELLEGNLELFWSSPRATATQNSRAKAAPKRSRGRH